jgi:uncharacterized membrane protein
MKTNKFALPFLLATFCLSAWAGAFNFLKVSDQRGTELRDAVEAHRAATRAEVQRGEAAAGRRLTPAELAELRQQVRQQWSPRQEVARSAESQPAERIVPVPDIKGAALGSPGRSRP